MEQKLSLILSLKKQERRRNFSLELDQNQLDKPNVDLPVAKVLINIRKNIVQFVGS